ncbi:hypothetical protein HMPREF1486_05521 [Streptomyces sp. HPH0547]|uniref:Uncharacterized protein n=1 Tax=Streptomyces albus TaxID=1888 RepID=A0A8H1LLT1_9ACTN|nr:hypothetical protein HMPREF1486_05521 [Streptomyces sp. HPH0547]KPC93146.1 hypothetical protein ADL27_20965 [Streptomyces sp. NRRL F-6602]TGG88072.1 hypothetical protein D8771_03930 [Streptomyces albus]GHJ22758.1 hypothetical protein TPA0909_43720 [Streptomyces albus]
MVHPACLFVVGAIFALNIRGAADYVYLRIERHVTWTGGGIGPGTLWIFGSVFFAFGVIAIAVEGVARL